MFECVCVGQDPEESRRGYQIPAARAISCELSSMVLGAALRSSAGALHALNSSSNLWVFIGSFINASNKRSCVGNSMKYDAAERNGAVFMAFCIAVSSSWSWYSILLWHLCSHAFCIAVSSSFYSILHCCDIFIALYHQMDKQPLDTLGTLKGMESSCYLGR